MFFPEQVVTLDGGVDATIDYRNDLEAFLVHASGMPGRTQHEPQIVHRWT
jgi:hypothetical protein